MRQSILLALTAAVADASLVIKRDSTSATPSVDTVSAADSADSSATETDTPTTEDICFLRNATGYSDFNAPCNILKAIQGQCTYGPRALEFLNLPLDREEDEYPNFNDPEWAELSPEAQRICYCQSQFTDAMLGCQACHAAQYGPEVDLTAGLKGYDSYQDLAEDVMSQYCDVDFKPEKSFAEFYDEATEDAIDDDEQPGSSPSTSNATASATSSINTSTDVSLYYTMQVTGTSLYDLSLPSPESSGGQITYTTSSTSDGEIVPTGVAELGSMSNSDSENGGVKNDDEASTTSSADSGAATAFAGGVGVLAFIGIAAAL